MLIIIYVHDNMLELHKKPFILSKDQHIGYIQSENVDTFLLSSHGNTEIMRVILHGDSFWTIGPSVDWDGQESILVVRGELSYINKNERLTLKEGDFLSLAGLKNVIQLNPKDTAEIIYTISKPIFKQYGNNIKNILSIANKVEEKDGYTADHCNRIKTFSMLIGNHMNFDSEGLYSLRFGSHLHDVGKLKVPDSILGKPSKLTQKEWEIMKQHTLFGSEMIREMNVPSLASSIPVIEQHHERYNGSGYPFGLNKNEIHIGAAVVAVVDSYDAMTSDRVYQKGRTSEEAIEEIQKNREILYHPDVVDAFMDKVEEIIK